MTIHMYAYTINLVYVLHLNESTQLKCKKDHVRTSEWEYLFFPSNLQLLLLFFLLKKSVIQWKETKHVRTTNVTGDLTPSSLRDPKIFRTKRSKTIYGMPQTWNVMSWEHQLIQALSQNLNSITCELEEFLLPKRCFFHLITFTSQCIEAYSWSVNILLYCWMASRSLSLNVSWGVIQLFIFWPIKVSADDTICLTLSALGN